MSFHGNIKIKIPEAGLSYFIYQAYTLDSKSYQLDISKLSTNCNQYLLDKYDDSPTRCQVTCIPLKLLQKITKSDSEDKEELLKLAIQMYDEKELINKYHIFFKPIFTAPVVTKDGWESIDNNSVKNDNRELWLSNRQLGNLMKSYVLTKERSIYIGVVYLSCFDNLNYEDMKKVYSLTSLRNQLSLTLADSKYDYVFGYIVSYSHWSSIIIDKKLKRIYHYCSGGNNPDHYPSNDSFIFYSTYRNFYRSNSLRIKPKHRVVSKHAIFSHLSSEEYTVFLNVESSQLLSGECGTYASLFLILYITNNVNTYSDIKSLYNSFSFLGDKMMGLYKDLLFWREKYLPIKTTYISYDRAKDWKIILASQADRLNRLQNKLLEDMNILNKELHIENV